jgi:hypothetical protein
MFLAPQASAQRSGAPNKKWCWLFLQTFESVLFQVAQRAIVSNLCRDRTWFRGATQGLKPGHFIVHRGTTEVVP